MKKIIPALLFAALFLTFAACGSEDEPNQPVSQMIESLDQNENDAHFKFDINTDKDSSSIYIYNVKFSEQMPVTVNIRIDAPCTADKTGKVFSFAGTNIIPNLMMGSTPTPFPTLRVNNLRSVVDVEKKTYSISFDCQGTAMGKEINGHYDKEGSLK